MSEMRKKYVPLSTVVYACIITALTFGNIIFAALFYFQKQDIAELRLDVQDAYTDTVNDLKDLMLPYEGKKQTKEGT